MRPVNRIQPVLPVQSMKTYAVLSTKQPKPESCADAKCELYNSGWITVVDVATDLGRRQADYIRGQSGRTFTEDVDGTMVQFLFGRGQSCFAGHVKSDDTPDVYLVRDGDWRGNPRRQQRIHDTPEHWLEDFAGHQERLAKGQQ